MRILNQIAGSDRTDGWDGGDQARIEKPNRALEGAYGNSRDALGKSHYPGKKRGFANLPRQQRSCRARPTENNLSLERFDFRLVNPFPKLSAQPCVQSIDGRAAFQACIDDSPRFAKPFDDGRVNGYLVVTLNPGYELLNRNLPALADRDQWKRSFCPTPIDLAFASIA